MNHNAVCRIALATPGLLITEVVDGLLKSGLPCLQTSLLLTLLLINDYLPPEPLQCFPEQFVKAKRSNIHRMFLPTIMYFF